MHDQTEGFFFFLIECTHQVSEDSLGVMHPTTASTLNLVTGKLLQQVFRGNECKPRVLHNHDRVLAIRRACSHHAAHDQLLLYVIFGLDFCSKVYRF